MHMHKMIGAQATPQNVAVSFNRDHFTHTQLDCRANQLANYLRSMGVGRGDRVAVFLERGLEMVVALLATLKSGAAYLPMDPTLPHDRRTFMINDAQVPVVLSQTTLTENRCISNRESLEIAGQSTARPENLA